MPHDFGHELPKAFTGESKFGGCSDHAAESNRDNLGYHEHPFVRKMAERPRSRRISSELANRGSRSWKN
jgi:hypothetical protein